MLLGSSNREPRSRRRPVTLKSARLMALFLKSQSNRETQMQDVWIGRQCFHFFFMYR